jgi:hypothetical protein
VLLFGTNLPILPGAHLERITEDEFSAGISNAGGPNWLGSSGADLIGMFDWRGWCDGAAASRLALLEASAALDGSATEPVWVFTVASIPAFASYTPSR